jgi:hypothetical protein
MRSPRLVTSNFPRGNHVPAQPAQAFVLGRLPHLGARFRGLAANILHASLYPICNNIAAWPQPGSRAHGRAGLPHPRPPLSARRGPRPRDCDDRSVDLVLVHGLYSGPSRRGCGLLLLLTADGLAVAVSVSLVELELAAKIRSDERSAAASVSPGYGRVSAPSGGLAGPKHATVTAARACGAGTMPTRWPLGRWWPNCSPG